MNQYRNAIFGIPILEFQTEDCLLCSQLYPELRSLLGISFALVGFLLTEVM